MGSRYAPGFAGYVLGVCVSDLVCACCLLVIAMATAGDSPDADAVIAAILYLPMLGAEVAIVGFPVALAGVLVLEVVCRRVRSQAVHVAVAGVAGFLLTLAYVRVTGLDTVWLLPLLVATAVGVSAGAGRAAVIPLAPTWRARA